MSRRLTFFLFTATLGLMAALLVNSALKSREAKIAALRQSTVQIVVAARSLAPGETLDATALKLTSWPREQIPAGAFTEFEPVMGKVVKDSFGINQPLVAAGLLEADKTGGVLPLLIPPGLRAMSIAVDDVSDMAGFILPHSRVDVLVTVTVSGPSGPGAIGEVTKIVLQNIRVLAVAQTLEAGPDQPREVKVVTLLVSPLDAERLAAASKVGTLSLAMRNFADQDQLATAGVTLPVLLGMPAGEPPPPTPPPQEPLVRDRPMRPRRDGARAVEVIRNGVDHQTIHFVDGRVVPVGAPPSPPPAPEDSPPPPEGPAPDQ
jgi:pilus assembly protein CpaB